MDLSDDRDLAGLMYVGIVDRAVAPLWKDSENFSLQFVGIALTAKFILSRRMQVPDALFRCL